MFNNHVEDEADFCEAYKSQILNNSSTEEKSFFNILSKILTILLLLIIIIGVSIYGYNYIVKEASDSFPPSSVQIADDELVVTEEEEIPVGVMPPKVKELDSNKSSSKKVTHPLAIPTTLQSEYLEELSKLSAEIDKDSK